MSTPRPRTDLPTIEDDTRPFWDAAKEHRFLVRKCNACSEIHHYPRPFCPSCWSDDLAWLEASGNATLYTWSTVFMNDLPPFNERLPYIAAVVELEEGPKVMTNLIECNDTDLVMGMALRVQYRPLDDTIVAPYFSPA